MIHFEHELNEMVNRMLGGGLQSSILAAYQQELVEAKTLYEQCLELILRFAFHLLRLRLATWSCGVACRRQVIKSHGASPLPPGEGQGLPRQCVLRQDIQWADRRHLHIRSPA